jgi:hypothetical protein
MKQVLLVLVIAILAVAGSAVGFIGGVTTRQTVTATATATIVTAITVTTTTGLLCPALSVQNPEEGSTDFTVGISFQGQWSATVKTYSAFETTPAYLQTTCDYYGSSAATVYVVPWNPNGEQTVVVTANKLASSNGNLTVSVGWGEAFRSNSTVSPYGSTSTFISIAP